MLNIYTFMCITLIIIHTKITKIHKYNKYLDNFFCKMICLWSLIIIHSSKEKRFIQWCIGGQTSHAKSNCAQINVNNTYT